jgi:hypothetical protein
MDTKPTATTGAQGVPEPQAAVPPTGLRRVWLAVRARLLGGFLLVLPILITFWVIYWLYSSLEKYVIDPLALLVLWQVEGYRPDTKLPYWFETYAAPLIAIVIAVVLLYVLGFFVRSRVRRAIDWMLLRLPVISLVYSGVRNVFQAVERQSGEQRGTVPPIRASLTSSSRAPCLRDGSGTHRHLPQLFAAFSSCSCS